MLDKYCDYCCLPITHAKMQSMDNTKIQFEEPEYHITEQSAQNNLFVNFLIKTGLVKNEKQAMYVLFGVIGVCVLIIIFFISKSSNTNITEKNIFNPETAAPDISDIPQRI